MLKGGVIMDVTTPEQAKIAEQAGAAAVMEDVPMTFIRAPYIEQVTAPDVEVLATVDGHIVAARQRNMLATSFHPELNDDPRIHRWFIEHLIEKPE